MTNITEYEPGFYYATRLASGGFEEIPETIVRITPDKRLIDTHNLIVSYFDYDILGPVPRLSELEAMDAKPWNPVAEQTPHA